MGIFGYISIYLTTLSQNGNVQYLQFGVVSSFVLFILVSIEIFLKAFESHDLLIPNKENFKRFLFIVPFSMLILTVVQFLFKTYTAFSTVILGFVSYVLAVSFFFGILRIIGKRLKKIMFVLIILIIASLIGFIYMVNQGLIVFAIFFGSLTTCASINLIIISLNYNYEKYKEIMAKYQYD